MRTFFFILIGCCSLVACSSETPSVSEEQPPQLADSFILGMGYDFVGNGKDHDAPILNTVFTKTTVDSIDYPIINAELVEALEQHLRLLTLRKQNKKQKIANIETSVADMEKTIRELLAWQYSKPTKLSDVLDAYQVWGEDKRGNVHFTGYFTPIVKVSKTPTDTYRHPIYAKPKNWQGQLPSRREIEQQGLLNGLGLELAYAKSRLDIYFMQVQGSGYAEFPDGKRKLFGYGGANGYPYRSIGRYLVQNDAIKARNISMDGIKRFFQKNPHLMDEVLFSNPSYTFFTIKNSVPKGAGHVPLTPFYSVAADRDYFPLGSCMIARVPIISPDGVLQKHEWRFLLAQDIGGAIRGAGHLDVYYGIGETGKNYASALHHYGKVWLLLPKKTTETTKSKPHKNGK